MYPQSMFLSKNKENITILHLYSSEKLQYITWACFRNEENVISTAGKKENFRCKFLTLLKT